MPKAREIARLQRRAARDLANRHVLSALADLAAAPPSELPPHLAAVYRDQVLHARARRTPRRVADPSPTEPQSEARNGAKRVQSARRP